MAGGSAERRFSPAPWSGPDQISGSRALPRIGPNRRCALRCYPQTDPQFEADVRSALAESLGSARAWPEVLENVRQRIRQDYPFARIQPRHPLAAHGDPNELWYCYRDGAFPSQRRGAEWEGPQGEARPDARALPKVS